MKQSPASGMIRLIVESRRRTYPDAARVIDILSPNTR